MESGEGDGRSGGVLGGGFEFFPFVREDSGSNMDVEPGVRPGAHVLGDLFGDEFFLDERFEDFSSEEFSDIDGGQIDGRVEEGVL